MYATTAGVTYVENVQRDCSDINHHTRATSRKNEGKPNHLSHQDEAQVINHSSQACSYTILTHGRQ
ncbi:hypothetical protein PILCRDRAFT_822029 [Piloderma croceum F 1598]|uniref:Uncharacterized protein n=1 Tax=Piloderma croceum (strain F 1598) TaxID=765440 RepID=A0A0C3B3J9_PILCF|nr:hypothetical protein PILCRDRAFT_822029 [Piloderma croceum F 1598]